MSRLGWVSVVAAGTLLLAACGDDGDASEEASEPNEEVAADEPSSFCVEVIAVEEGMEDAFLSDDGRTFADLLVASFDALSDMEPPNEIADDWQLWTETQQQFYEGMLDIAPDDEAVDPDGGFDDPALTEELEALEADLGLDDLDGEVYEAEGRVIDYLDTHCLLDEDGVPTDGSEPAGQAPGE